MPTEGCIRAALRLVSNTKPCRCRPGLQQAASKKSLDLSQLGA